VVRWKKGSFPAAFKNIVTAVVIAGATIFLLKEILEVNVTSLIATTTVLTATIGWHSKAPLPTCLPASPSIWRSRSGRATGSPPAATRECSGHHAPFDPDADDREQRGLHPNSYVLAGAVVNYSLPDQATIRKVTVGVSYHVAPNTSGRLSWTCWPRLPVFTASPNRWCGS